MLKYWEITMIWRAAFVANNNGLSHAKLL